MIRSAGLVLCLFFACSSFAQSTPYPMESILKAELDSLAAGGNKINRYVFNSSNEKYFLTLLKGYENSPEIMVQLRVVDLQYTIAMGSKDSLVRQSVVIDLLNALEKNPSLSQSAANSLVAFQEHDFSKEAIHLLEEKYQRFQSVNNFILLCGIAQVKSVIPYLEKTAIQFDNRQIKTYNEAGWFARLALARMKTTSTIDTLIAAVELYPEKAFRVSKLLKQIAYTRHRDALRLLLNYLKSTDIVSAGQGGFEFAVNAYAMEFLATYIENFPVKAKYFTYFKDDIALGIAYLEKIIGN